MEKWLEWVIFLFALAVSTLSGSFLYQALSGDQNWAAALERSFFMICGGVTVVVANEIANRTKEQPKKTSALKEISRGL